jgi:hypothetical protein
VPPQSQREDAVLSHFFCNAAQSFGKKRETVCVFGFTRNEDHKPKTKKENQIMKNRKNILTYIVAALSMLVVSASSSPGTQPLEGPENYTGSLTHGEFVSCEGQILNPPAYAVDGTWVLHIERMTEPQVPPPADLTLVVFRDGHRYFTLPHIALTPVSLEDGIYTYTWGLQATATLDTNTTPATFAWHVVFDDNCTTRSYGMLTYFGFANN